MNEILFLLQILIIVGFALGAMRLGKSALVGWVAIQALIANLFILKQITLFGFEVTASDAYVIGSLLGLNLLQEHHGQQEAQKATWTCFFFMVFFTLISQVHLLYQPSAHDIAHGAYYSVLSQSPRLLVASMGVFFCVQQFDVRFFNILKKSFPSFSFSVRAGIALVISQFLDTVLFSFAGLYGIVASIFDVITLSFAVKLIVIMASTSILRWSKV